MKIGDEGVVIVVVGELDLATAPELRAALEEIDADGDRSTTIDLADCSFVDSTGITVIVEAGRRLKGTTRKLFELTQTDRLPYLDISDKNDAATAS